MFRFLVDAQHYRAWYRYQFAVSAGDVLILEVEYDGLLGIGDWEGRHVLLAHKVKELPYVEIGPGMEAGFDQAEGPSRSVEVAVS